MRSLRIFIVDDDPDFAETLALVLEGRGHQVEVVHSGEKAIEEFKRRDFDLTFMDLKLPGKNGLESFLEIRSLRPSARVVMMTGYSIERFLDQAVANGAWGVMEKPIDIPRVLTMIEKVKTEGILVVDDDPDFLESISSLLAEEGYKVEVARDGREALECIRGNCIDILLLDLRMPVLGGLETCEELKRSGYDLATLIITAYADAEHEAIGRLRSMDINVVLKKPFDPQDLLDALGSLVA